MQISCPHCKSTNIRAYIKLSMYIDVQYLGKLTKKVIAKKSTEIWGMDDKYSLVCEDCTCSWGYGYDY